MPYREKIAWLSLIAMVVTFGPYFTLVAFGPFHDDAVPNFRQLGLYAVVAVVQVLILGAGHLVLRRRAPRDARMPLDERDLDIKRRSITAAYYVLIAGMILVGVVMPFQSHGWAIVNAALFWIVVAEVVHYAVTVACYRRQRG